MKKVFLKLVSISLLFIVFIVNTLTLTSCSSILSSSSVAKKLEDNKYKSTVLNCDETIKKMLFLNWEDVSFIDGLSSTKGEGDDTDILLAIFFSDFESAEKFVNRNEYENLKGLDLFLTYFLGSKLQEQKKVGYHNNVVFAGSQTSFDVAFNL